MGGNPEKVISECIECHKIGGTPKSFLGKCYQPRCRAIVCNDHYDKHVNKHKEDRDFGFVMLFMFVVWVVVFVFSLFSGLISGDWRMSIFAISGVVIGAILILKLGGKRTSMGTQVCVECKAIGRSSGERLLDCSELTCRVNLCEAHAVEHLNKHEKIDKLEDDSCCGSGCCGGSCDDEENNYSGA